MGVVQMQQTWRGVRPIIDFDRPDAPYDRMTWQVEFLTEWYKDRPERLQRELARRYPEWPAWRDRHA